jgi:predicted DNA-binding WGR domain protein
MWTWLKRIDPEEDVNRWYAVGVQPGLLDGASLIRFWGSRETFYQQMSLEPFPSNFDARAAADRLIRIKLRRGYRFVGGYLPEGMDPMPTDSWSN